MTTVASSEQTPFKPYMDNTGESFDYQDVEHNVVTTPLVAGRAAADKRKQALKAMEGPASGINGRKNDKENHQSMAAEDLPPTKRPKVADAWAPREGEGDGGRGGGGKGAPPSSSQEEATDAAAVQHTKPPPPPPSHQSTHHHHHHPPLGGGCGSNRHPPSVRYPRLVYADKVPDTDEHYHREDIPGEHKLVYLARRVMEADIKCVGGMLSNTKYSNLSHEMEKFANLVEERLMRQLGADTAEEEEERQQYIKLKAKHETSREELQQIEEKARRLQEEITKWEEMEKQLEKEEGAAGKGKKGGKEGDGDGDEDEEDGEGIEEPAYMSPVMKDTHALLQGSGNVRSSAYKAATRLMGTLEEKLPVYDEVEGQVNEACKSLADEYKAAQFAGFPAEVEAPKKAAKGLSSAKGAGGERER